MTDESKLVLKYIVHVCTLLCFLEKI
jgi:hypothetical protein